MPKVAIDSIPSSPAPSTASQKKWPRMADVANIFIRLKRHQELSKGLHIESSSGEAYTNPALAVAGATCDKRMPVVESEYFVCLGAVDAPRLLRAVRSSLYEKAVAVGANVLIDEMWKCTVSGPQRGVNRMFRVHITYSASASRSDAVVDPQKPIAVDRVIGVPGLMTILSRE